MRAIYQPAGRAGEYSPLACNLYMTCSHGCRYCYVPQTIKKTKEQFFVSAPARPGILDALDKDARRMALFGEIDKEVLFCFTCDPFQSLEDGIAESALQIMAQHKIPFVTLTKSGTKAIHLLKHYSPRDAFAVSLTLHNPDWSKKWEPSAALPQDRLDGLRAAHEAGIRTWASMEPVINAAESLAVIEAALPFTDHFKIGAISGVPTVVQAVNWKRFHDEAIKMITRAGRTYYIKHDLETLT